MCGIVGYVGKQKASAILVEGLKRLEYRGYDSAGIALLENNDIEVMKKTGRVQNVAELIYERDMGSQIGISHTRWATHGEVNDSNAHPHMSWNGKLALVHNGVIENYEGLRRFLEGEGVEFLSETDTEVFANLIAYHYDKEEEGNSVDRLLAAVRHSTTLVEGTYGIAVICTDCPNDIIGARKGSPLCLGVGNGENMIASDVSAFVGRTQNVVYLDDGQIVHISEDDFSISTIGRESVDPVINQIDWKIEQAELGHFTHYMEKEIFEQPTALENSMRGRFSDDDSTAKFGGLNLDPVQWRQIDRILFCACGTTWHACLTAEYLIEKYARIPVEVEYASEFRYRNAPLDKNTLVFVISQSGETLDTLEALREAKRKGYIVLGITNGVGSSIARETDGGIYQHAGPEIGVASTKAFTSQILLSGMLALHLGRMRDLSFGDGREMVAAFRSLPGLVSTVLDQADKIKEIAEKYADFSDFLFLGRQSMFPIALEGALKLKEISYIHAEGYPAGEMKHGPIALISEECPSVILSPHGDTLKKVISNIQETRARKGSVIAITSAGKDFPQDTADEIIHIPQAHDCIMPILATIPLQLLAYYIAVKRGCDVDKPRNLAKSVTVE
ncbi:glutamine--fructose-6-phosphate transaminase (isomerizing) [Rubellicoccus peritrichatus]|uniref:Glutamine--fructose-6-phosphate aminotransferase [isomerizing] n=1 Tax=Rubellicoccus peritrichatus TaxID=3080537 RepID=A0AAQ3QU24_9BACT|nr:glutamine--fructose-6-phosphate transaminase (isomerizing) [Puniceicoccus sp. CR14]WOO41971.1 glutamine--fructose-6-phosphate transaminase (isomerizing) [Puniceicoccus sp. CR14]